MLLRRRELFSVLLSSGATCFPISARRWLAPDSFSGLPLLEIKNNGISGMPTLADSWKRNGVLICKCTSQFFQVGVGETFQVPHKFSRPARGCLVPQSPGDIHSFSLTLGPHAVVEFVDITIWTSGSTRRRWTALHTFDSWPL